MEPFETRAEAVHRERKLKFAGLVVILLISSIFGLASAWRLGAKVWRSSATPRLFATETQSALRLSFSRCSPCLCGLTLI